MDRIKNVAKADLSCILIVPPAKADGNRTDFIAVHFSERICEIQMHEGF